jgi:hypothetical protein
MQGETGNSGGVLLRKHEKDQIGRTRLNNEAIRKLFWNKSNDRARNGFMWFETGTNASCCACGNEPSHSVYCGKFLEELRN